LSALALKGEILAKQIIKRTPTPIAKNKALLKMINDFLFFSFFLILFINISVLFRCGLIYRL